MRRRLSYANVAATLALVLSMSGGALAAKHYLISSTKQIKPSVIKQLRGHTGAKGPNGPQGIPGTAGPGGKEGAQGAPGPLLAVLPSGKTLRGAFGAGGGVAVTGAFISASISYPFPLASNVISEVVQEGGAPTADCPGSSAAPSAAAGFLCVYVNGGNSLATKAAGTYGDNGKSDYKFGGVVYAQAGCIAPCSGEFWGTWAVTAP